MDSSAHPSLAFTLIILLKQLLAMVISGHHGQYGGHLFVILPLQHLTLLNG